MKRDPIIRLRKANPLPLVPTVNGADLLARITASPPDPRLLSRRRAVTRRPAIALALVLAVAAALAFTAVGVSSGWFESAAVKPPVTRHEYRAAQHQLTLPPGYTWPELHIDPRSVTSVGAGGGNAVVVAEAAWSCYWVDAIRSGDTAAQHRSHDELVSLLENNVIVAPNGAPENWTPPNPPNAPYAVFADDGGYQALQKGYADAAAGHPQFIVDYCKANKPGG
jgi:hypothetical protein